MPGSSRPRSRPHEEDTLDQLLSIAFEAHHAEKNHHRRYEAVIGRDLLGDWTLTLRYGRIGQSGREQRHATPEATAIQAILRERLRRRLSAPKRIDCPYRLTAFRTAPGFDSSSWLPAEMMGRFFQVA